VAAIELGGRTRVGAAFSLVAESKSYTVILNG
jgi:hypothetical protein